MKLANLLMNYPQIRGQVAEFQAECGSDEKEDYQVKWLWPSLFPFAIRLKIRYLPSSKEDDTFQKVLPLSIRV